MDSHHATKYNPWSTDDSAVGLRSLVILGEKTGHTAMRGKIDDFVVTKLEEMPSMRMIKLQKEISQKNEQMSKVNFDIQKRMLYHETKDITDINVIEKRTKAIKNLSDHLQSVIYSKEALITRLQQPHVGDFIKLEAAFHKHASELFSQLGPLLSDLTPHLQDLSWVNGNSFVQSELDNHVTELSGALARIQTAFQCISQMSQCIHSLRSADDSRNLDPY